MAKFPEQLRRATKLRIALPSISYEVALDDLLASETVDTRIAKLSEIKRDLEAAIGAVHGLQEEAQERKVEADHLRRGGGHGFPHYLLTPVLLDAPVPDPILPSGQGVGTTLLSQHARMRVQVRWPVSRPTREGRRHC